MVMVVLVVKMAMEAMVGSWLTMVVVNGECRWKLRSRNCRRRKRKRIRAPVEVVAIEAIVNGCRWRSWSCSG